MAQRKVDIKMVEEDGTLISSVDFTVTDALSPYDLWRQKPGNGKKTEQEYIDSLAANRVKASVKVELTTEELIDGPDYVIVSFTRNESGDVEVGKSIQFNYEISMSDGSPMPEQLYVGMKMTKDGEGQGKVQSYDYPKGSFSMSLDEVGEWTLTLSVRSLLTDKDIDFPLAEPINVIEKPTPADYEIVKFERVNATGPIGLLRNVFLDYEIRMTDGSPMPSELMIKNKAYHNGQYKFTGGSNQPPKNMMVVDFDTQGKWMEELVVISPVDGREITRRLKEPVVVFEQGNPERIVTKLEMTPIEPSDVVKVNDRLFIDYMISMTDGTEPSDVEGSTIVFKHNGIEDSRRDMPPSSSMRMQFKPTKAGTWEVDLVVPSNISGNPDIVETISFDVV